MTVHQNGIPPKDPVKHYDRTSYILVVDDDDTLLKFFKIHLNKFFSKVIVVRNAKEAIAALKEKNIDLVLSDIRMPRMDGLQFMKKVRAHDPTIPVFLVSGALLSDEQSHDADEADGFLKKPFSIDDFHQFINQGMKRREHLKLLGELIKDRKQINDILSGKLKPEDLKDEAIRSKVIDIIFSIKKAS